LAFPFALDLGTSNQFERHPGPTAVLSPVHADRAAILPPRTDVGPSTKWPSRRSIFAASGLPAHAAFKSPPPAVETRPVGTGRESVPPRAEASFPKQTHAGIGREAKTNLGRRPPSAKSARCRDFVPGGQNDRRGCGGCRHRSARQAQGSGARRSAQVSRWPSRRESITSMLPEEAWDARGPRAAVMPPAPSSATRARKAILRGRGMSATLLVLRSTEGDVHRDGSGSRGAFEFRHGHRPGAQAQLAGSSRHRTWKVRVRQRSHRAVRHGPHRGPRGMGVKPPWKGSS